MKTRHRLLQVVVSMLIYNFTVTAFSWCFKLVTDSLINKNFQLFYSCIWLTVFVVVIQVISNYMYIKGKNIYIKDNMIKMKLSFIESIFDYDISRFKQRDVSEYQSFLFNDLNMYEQKVIAGKFDIHEKIVLLLFSGGAIIAINPHYILLVIALFGVSIGVPFLFGRYARKFNSSFCDSCTKAMDKLAEMMSGFIILRTFSIEKKGIVECKEVIEDMETSKMEYKSIMAIFQSVLMFMTTILTLVIFIWGGNGVINEEISVGELIALIQLLFNIANPLMGIMTAISNIKAAKPLEEKYRQFINEKRKDGKGKFSFENYIKLEHLSFSYFQDDRIILNNINYQFEKNKKYAIVGENGSGKSTLLKLIAGEIGLDEYQGNILIDNIERKNLQDISFWENVAYIPQQVFLFKKKLVENIFLDKNDNKYDNFNTLIKKLDVEKLIEKDGCLDNDEYIELSGGEKQKIAFVREVLKSSSIILADEPDSALDLESGVAVQEILLKLNKTCIVVTHRISNNLANYDEIIVLENGMIVESGDYYKLMKQQGYFYRMCKNNL